MIKIIIKNPDGSERWKESFKTLAEANAWLSEERTRPYWQNDFVVEIEDRTIEKAAELEAKRQAQQVKDNARKSDRDAMLALRQKNNKSTKDVEDLLNMVVDFITGKNL